MNMEFKPDALKDLSDCKISNNQDGLQGQLKGRIFDEPILTGNKCEGDLFRDTDLKLRIFQWMSLLRCQTCLQKIWSLMSQSI